MVEIVLAVVITSIVVAGCIALLLSWDSNDD